jgi:lipopolysaccharide export system permease protein
VILDTSFRREAARSLIATLVVVLTVVMTWLLFRILRQSGQGQIDPKDVASFIGLSTLGYLPLVLTVALFITLILVLIRWYRDSEMAIWFSSGMGIMRLVKPVLQFAWPVLLAIAALTLLVWPWSNAQMQTLRDQFERRNDLARAEPGQFRESSDGQRVFFFEGVSDSDAARRVFVRLIQGDTETVTLASEGRILRTADGTFLDLSEGRRYEFYAPGSAKAGESRLAEFKQYLIKVKDNAAVLPALQVKSRPTQSLLSTVGQPPSAKGELFWRLSVPISAFLLCLLAVPLAAVQQRSGKGLHVVFAFLVCLVYFNFNNLGQGWVTQQRVGWWQLLIGLHLMAFMLFALLAWRRSTGWTLRNTLTRLATQRAQAVA